MHAIIESLFRKQLHGFKRNGVLVKDNSIFYTASSGVASFLTRPKENLTFLLYFENGMVWGTVRGRPYSLCLGSVNEYLFLLYPWQTMIIVTKATGRGTCTQRDWSGKIEPGSPSPVKPPPTQESDPQCQPGSRARA
ncbi:hypothetical protein BC830DRAFT_479134 [Chytriomyces sp. MP71]|nr:hypothetical protein BC830DRAFT_479134 [Chytriomyces sp. MP71]